MNVWIFLVLVFAGAAMERVLLRDRKPRVAAGGAVMALGIFVMASGTTLLSQRGGLWQVAGWAVLWLWILVVWRLARGTFRYGPRRFTASEIWAVGTWVAGTAVPASVAAMLWPGHLWPARGLALLATVIFLPYSGLFLRAYAGLVRDWRRQESSGEILLATVSTQALLLAFHAAWPGILHGWLVTAAGWFAAVLLVCGIALIAAGLRKFSLARLADDWSNTNCILHGAISITGLSLTLALVNSVPLLFLWRFTAAMFVAVEGVELLRAVQRVRKYGWRAGLWVYDTSQWARNFTFGMFYAFSLILQGRLPPEVGDWSLALVVQWGRFAVLTLLVAECALFCGSCLRGRRRIQNSDPV